MGHLVLAKGEVKETEAFDDEPSKEYKNNVGDEKENTSEEKFEEQQNIEIMDTGNNAFSKLSGSL